MFGHKKGAFSGALEDTPGLVRASDRGTLFLDEVGELPRWRRRRCCVCWRRDRFFRWEHAHQKAIIHRDLKPSNIIVSTVDGKAQPKIIDFGIAKATGPQLIDNPLHTALGAIGRCLARRRNSSQFASFGFANCDTSP
jgi:serine/threonine protein kinase